MKSLLKAEELSMFLLAILAFNHLNYAWWIFPALLLIPDLSMLGYLVNNTFGAFLYNLFHSRVLAVLVFFSGYYTNAEILQLAGVILFAHACMDRVFGYGLKYVTGFKFTHLGEIGQPAKPI